MINSSRYQVFNSVIMAKYKLNDSITSEDQQVVVNPNFLENSNDKFAQKNFDCAETLDINGIVKKLEVNQLERGNKNNLESGILESFDKCSCQKVALGGWTHPANGSDNIGLVNTCCFEASKDSVCGKVGGNCFVTHTQSCVSGSIPNVYQKSICMDGCLNNGYGTSKSPSLLFFNKSFSK